MRINKLVTAKENALIFRQFFSTISLRKCIKTSLENLYSKWILIVA